jgi:DNA sulfur modification protein DndB
MIQINVPANDLPSLLQEKPSVGNDPKSGKHRPEIKGHVEEIKQYIVERTTQDKPWILGTLTANVAPEKISVEELGRGICIVVIPHNVKLDITDGQHSKLAIKSLSKYSDLISNNSFPIRVVLEGSFKQCQTDFLDLAQAKQVNPTFLSSFNDSARHQITEKIIEKVCIFKNKTDKFNKAPSRNDKLIYTTKYIATSVSCSFADNPNDELEDYDVEKAADSLAKCLNNFFSECIQTQYIYETNVEKLTIDEVVEFKNNCLLAVSVGVEILGRLLYCTYEPENIFFNSNKVSQLAKLDWSRESRLWQNNVVRVNSTQKKQTKKITWGASAVADAVKAVKAELGWM